MSWLHLVFASGGGAVLVALVRQFRLWSREWREVSLARHMVNHSLSTSGLDGYTDLVRERQHLVVERKRVTQPPSG